MDQLNSLLVKLQELDALEPDERVSRQEHGVTELTRELRRLRDPLSAGNTGAARQLTLTSYKLTEAAR